jgi:hypothetical protein
MSRIQNGGPKGISGHRYCHRSRSLMGTFGRVEIAVPRARLDSAVGKTTEWKSSALRRLPASNQASRFADCRRLSCRDQYASGAASPCGRLWRRGQQDTVSRVWRKVKDDWDTWNTRSLAEEPVIRLILDGTVVRVRLDRKATAIVLLVVLGVREDGQKVLLAAKNMGGETSQAWRAVSRRSRPARAAQARVSDRRRRHWVGASTGHRDYQEFVRGGRLKQSGHGHCEALAEQDSELGLGHRPLARWHDPLFLGAVQHQEEEFCSGVVTWEMTPGSDRPAELGIQSLNSIGGV